MKLASYTANGQAFYGHAVDGGMIALSPDFPEWATLKDVIAADGIRQLEQTVSSKTVTHADGSYTYDIPIPNTEKIICVGVNYLDPNSPYHSDSTPPEHMTLFFRTVRSFVGHGHPLVRPKPHISEQLDYEAEIAVVIGKQGRYISAQHAYDHIAGFTLCNEGSVRDWVAHSKFNVTPGKNFEQSGSMGPWMVPFANAEQLDDLLFTAHVNGELRQRAYTKNMIHSIRSQIAYISTFTTLVAGDIIVTGTPGGSGARQNPPVFLQQGDVVTIESDSIGQLKNSVIDG